MRTQRLFFIVAGIIMSVFFSGCAGTPPQDLGIHEGQLKSCPNSPNCVNSQGPTNDTEHAIAPLSYAISRQQAHDALIALLQDWPRVTIIDQQDDYIRCEFASAVMGFIDDVEFYFSSPGRIDVRSASRLGHSDLGVNRKRIEAIREQFAAAAH